jgi:hypothetical protein
MAARLPNCPSWLLTSQSLSKVNHAVSSNPQRKSEILHAKLIQHFFQCLIFHHIRPLRYTPSFRLGSVWHHLTLLPYLWELIDMSTRSRPRRRRLSGHFFCWFAMHFSRGAFLLLAKLLFLGPWRQSALSTRLSWSR